MTYKRSASNCVGLYWSILIVLHLQFLEVVSKESMTKITWMKSNNIIRKKLLAFLLVPYQSMLSEKAYLPHDR
jgi:hypothetical protein